MGQLIKLSDCISRYEANLNYYTNHFMKVKKLRKQKFSSSFSHLDAEKRKELFSDQMFRHQLTWATRTPYERSECSADFQKDTDLNRFLSQLDDSALILYWPVLRLEQADVQLDVMLLLTPFAAYIFKVLEGEKDSVFQGRNKRQWAEITSESEKLIINPQLSVQRAYKILNKLFKESGLDFPIICGIVSWDSYIEFAATPAQWEVLDKAALPAWLYQRSRHIHPFKYEQLKAAEVILSVCETLAAERE